MSDLELIIKALRKTINDPKTVGPELNVTRRILANIYLLICEKDKREDEMHKQLEEEVFGPHGQG